MHYTWIGDPMEKQTLCKKVLDDLPEWFGIPSAVADYVDGVVDKPFLAAYHAREPVGFYALREENNHTLDMYVLGVKKAYHSKGIGAHMQTMVNRFARNKGYRNLIVITLAEKARSDAYKKTRSFYERMGFTPVYQSDEIWDEENPAVIYVLCLDRSTPSGPYLRIDTGRLIVRPYRPDDLEAFHEIFSDPEVMKSCEPAYSETKSKTTLRSFIETRIAYAVEQKKEKRLIGHLLFKQMPSEDEGVYEIGWIFNRAYWNRGYAFEASSAMIDHGFKNLGVHKVIAETIDTDRSLPLMKKLGMVHEAILRKQVKHDGAWRDLHVAGILSERDGG